MTFTYEPMKPSRELATVLLRAYEPCIELQRACHSEMRWNPAAGHIPRGFLGATGNISEIELVLVFAEPGDPHPEETHGGFDSAYAYATKVMKAQRDPFHRNVRKILDMCWPDMPFEEQLHKTWLTESVLCSAPKECGPVSKSAWQACGSRYLQAQLALLPHALVVALGNKAQQRLRSLGIEDFLSVRAAAPPGCYTSGDAEKTWATIPVELARRRSAR